MPLALQMHSNVCSSRNQVSPEPPILHRKYRNKNQTYGSTTHVQGRQAAQSVPSIFSQFQSASNISPGRLPLVLALLQRSVLVLFRFERCLEHAGVEEAVCKKKETSV